MTPEQTLAWEAEHRSRVVLATIGAAVLTALGLILGAVGLGQLPEYDDRVLTVVDTLRLAADGQPIAPGRLAAQTIYLGDHAVLPIIAAILYGLGTLLVFPALGYLFRATRARRPQLPQIALVMASIGVVGFGVGRAAGEVGRYVGAMQFVDQADQSNSAAKEALSNGAATAGQMISTFGGLALGVAFVMIALNAMRVGLLTRFMGMLGVIVGVTFVLPVDPQGIIRVFWLGALALLLAGRSPRGAPAAWASGTAEPWPTQQQLREARDAARAEQRGETAPEHLDAAAPQPRNGPPSAPLPTPAPRRPEPTTTKPGGSSKRKRKRRS